MSGRYNLFPFPGAIDFGSDLGDIDGQYRHCGVNKIVFDDTTDRILLACVDGAVRIYSAKTGALVRLLQRAAPSAVMGNGNTPGLSSSSSRGIIAIDIVSHGLVASIDGNSRLCLWRVSSGECLYDALGEFSTVAKVDESCFVTGSRSGELAFHSHCDGAVIVASAAIPAYPGRESREKVHRFHIAVSGRRMVTSIFGRNEPALWDLDSRRVVSNLADNSIVFGITNLHFCSLRIVAESRGMLSVWDAESQMLLCHVKVCSAVIGLTIIGENHLIFKKNTPDILRLVEISSGDVACEVGLNGCQRIAFSNDGRIAAWFGNCGVILPSPNTIPDLVEAQSLHIADKGNPAADNCMLQPLDTIAPLSSIRRRIRLQPTRSGKMQGDENTTDSTLTSTISTNNSLYLPSLPSKSAFSRPQTPLSPQLTDHCPLRSLPNFGLLRAVGNDAAAVEKLDAGEIADLIAAHLVGYRRRHAGVFWAYRASAESALLGEGIYGGEFLLGADAVVPGERWVELVVGRIKEDGRRMRSGGEGDLPSALAEAWLGKLVERWESGTRIVRDRDV